MRMRSGNFVGPSGPTCRAAPIRYYRGHRRLLYKEQSWLHGDRRRGGATAVVGGWQTAVYVKDKRIIFGGPRHF